MKQDSQQAIQLCKDHSTQDNNLWIQLLTMLSQMENLNMSFIEQVLDVLSRSQVVPLLYALHILSQNENIHLGTLRKYILAHMQRLKGCIHTV